ncbi:GNAT family N-acetyltransferase, partial [Desulfovibrio desulfuricans]|nr:GNAT family N-acetyltransferase [Desulfovibrio desulfuricans]
MMKIQREYPYLVCELDQKIIGYAYAHRHMERAGYQWNVELSIYLLPQVQHRQIGKALYTALLEVLKLQGLQ